MPDNDVEEVKGPSDSGAEKNNFGNREESNALQDQRTEELFKDRDNSTERQVSQQSGDNSESHIAARDKAVADSSAAARNGDSTALESGIKNAFEQSKGDTSKFKDFGDKLGQSLKDSGIKVDTKDNSISFEKNGNAVTYSMNDQLDLNSGKVNAEVKAESNNGQKPSDVVAGFKSESKDQQADQADAQAEKKEALGAQGGSADLAPAQKARGINKENRVVQEPASPDQNVEKPLAEQQAQRPAADSIGERPAAKLVQEPASDAATVEKPAIEKQAGQNERPAEQTTEKPAAEKQAAEKPAAAERQASEILKDPKSSAEDKLRAARDMAKNGETKFKGDDGREYRISTQKYGNREGVVVSTTDAKNGFMPVLRGLVGQDGTVSHQKDSRGREVDYAGNKASKELKNDAVLSTSKKADADTPVKPDAQNKPEAKKKPAQEENPGDNNKPKGDGLPKPNQNERPAEQDKVPVDNKDKAAEEKKVGPLGSAFVPVDKPQQKVETIASVYAQPQETASGRYFRPDEMTAAFNPAHLPKGLGLKDGDVIRVTHEGKSIDVTLTDRGPYVKGRGIDLSAAAGRALGITIEGKGVGKISFEKIGREPGFREAPRPKKK